MTGLHSPGAARPWRIRTVAVALAVVGALAGCAAPSSAHPSPSSLSSEPLDVLAECGGTHAGWHALPGAVVPTAVAGNGPTVVFANDSENDRCRWVDLAALLLRQHDRVALFNYSDSSLPDARLVRETLRVAASAANGGTYALVGASMGSNVVIQAAATHPRQLAAIVSLSLVGSSGSELKDLLSQTRTVTTPTLFVASQQDPFLGTPAEERALYHALRGSPNQLLQPRGSIHGVNLIDPLNSVQGDPREQVLRFLTQRLTSR